MGLDSMIKFDIGFSKLKEVGIVSSYGTVFVFPSVQSSVLNPKCHRIHV